MYIVPFVEMMSRHWEFGKHWDAATGADFATLDSGFIRHVHLTRDNAIGGHPGLRST